MRKYPIVLMLLASAPMAHAADPALDEVLQGFDAPAAEAPMEQVLDGFERPAGNDGMDAVLSGFDTAASTPTDAAVTSSDSSIRLSGALSFSTTYNYAHDAPAPDQTDWRGLSRARGKLNLELDADPFEHWRLHLAGYAWHDLAYQWNGRDQYTDAQLDEMETEAELGEAWLQGRLTSSVDLKLGRQIVVWGKSDNLRVTDVLNPLDARELGLTDIEDLRLPLAMSRLDWYRGDWNLTALAIHETRLDKRPVYGSDFYPAPMPQPADSEPSDGGGNTGYALALNGVFSGWDLSFYGASIIDTRPHMEDGRLQHNRIGMTGAALNIAEGNWLWKGEAAHFTQLRYSSLPGKEKVRSDLLLGLEYSGLHETTLSLEVANRHLHEWEQPLANEELVEDEVQWAARYTGEFQHDRLKLTALAVQYGHRLERGGFTRLQASYELATATTLSGGVVLYKPGAALPFNAIGDNDRLFADLKYSF